MAAKSNYLKNAILGLLFNGTAIEGLAINHTTSPLTTFTLALHTASPGAGGNQATSEIVYTGYTRMTVARTAIGWSVVNDEAELLADVNWPRMTGGPGGIVTHISIGTGVSDRMLYFGSLEDSAFINVVTNVIPNVRAGSIIREE